MVTVVVANHNGAAFVDDCLMTILRQTLRDIEIIVIDDASTDDSRDRIAVAARADGRIRLISQPVRAGPSAARNLGLEQARGQWIAVVDSDDLLHPERLARLRQQAEAADSDIAADNLLVFDHRDATPPYAFLPDTMAPRLIDLATYVRADASGQARQKLGYLKPLFRAAFIQRSGVRYPTDLQIAEDFSFVRSLLAAGARFHLFPGLRYFYRKHASSLSHRLAAADVEAMLADDRLFLALLGDTAPSFTSALAARRRGLEVALHYDALVAAIKQRQWLRAAAMAIKRPRAGLMLRQAVAARIGRPPARGASPARPPVCMITRRPVTGDAEQVLGPLIQLAATFAAAGLDAHLIVPSATRAPQRVALSQVAGMRAFKTVDMRSGRASLPAPGEYWGTEEALFIARYARPLADVVVADWLPGVDAAAFTMRPSSLLLVLVDGLPPEAMLPGFAPEWAMLARADAILAARREDASIIRRGCPKTPLILLPTGESLGEPPTAGMQALLTRVWPGAPAAKPRAGR